MSGPTVGTEPDPHRIPRSRSLGISRLQSLRRRPQLRQDSLPVDCTVSTDPIVRQESRRGKKLKKTTVRQQPRAEGKGHDLIAPSKSQTGSYPPSNPVHERNEQQPSCVEGVDQLATDGGKNASLPVDVDLHTVAVPGMLDTAGSVEQGTGTASQRRCERPTALKSHSSLAVVISGEERVNTPRRADGKLRRVKTIATSKFRTIAAAARRYSRKRSRTVDPGTSAAQPGLSMSHSDYDQFHHSETMQHEEKDATTTVVYAESNKLESVDARDTKRAATESEVIEQLRQDLSHAHSQIAELQKRCEAQSRDLESSNNLLNTADKSSDSDVVHALRRLNAEVQQNTTYMADWLAESFEFGNLMTNQTKEQSSAVQRASDHIGPILVKSLQIKTPDEIPMLLQIALQAYFTSVLCQTASSWAFEPGHNAFIDGIYQRLRVVEAQAISGRWRALGRAHIVQNWITHPESLVKAIMMSISDILLATGCTAPHSDIIQRVAIEFEEKIALLVDLARRLNKIFDEVISSDFEVFVVRPGEKFDDKKMEDTDGTESGIQGTSFVLCTTHLGLIKRIPIGTLWERGKKQKMIVLKAKVLSESFLNTED